MCNKVNFVFTAAAALKTWVPLKLSFEIKLRDLSIFLKRLLLLFAKLHRED